jgi:hypothetical protein
MWINEVLKTVMDVIENGTHSMKRASKSWNIPMNSFTNHLNGKTKSKKMGPRGVFTKEENAIVITWTLLIQECGPSINLQQLKMKVAKKTKVKVTPFQDGIPSNNWWYWFKCRHLEVNICKQKDWKFATHKG